MKHKHVFGTIRIAPSKGIAGLPKVGELVVEDALGLIVKVETKKGAEVMVRIPHGSFKFYSEVVGGALEAPEAKTPRKIKKIKKVKKVKKVRKVKAAATDAGAEGKIPRKGKKSKAARLALKKARLLKKKRLAKKGKHRKGKKSLKIANLLEGSRKL